MNTATKPRLIPFSDAMERAIRCGRKTQTRRHVGKALPSWARSFESTPDGVLGRGVLNNKPIAKLIPCRYGKPGDRLAVREALVRIDGLAHYAADGATVEDAAFGGSIAWKWSPSRLGAMYMPRYAARTFLEIVDLRIERLQSISWRDAIAEGISECLIPATGDHPDMVGYMVGPDDGVSNLDKKPQESYRDLWESINGKGSWTANPYVFAITFRVLEGPSRS